MSALDDLIGRVEAASGADREIDPKAVAIVERELLRLATCGDIPVARRRELLRLAKDLAGEHHRQRARPAPDLFFDPHYRRPGLRLRLAPSDEVIEPKREPLALLRALRDGGGDAA